MADTCDMAAQLSDCEDSSAGFSSDIEFESDESFIETEMEGAAGVQPYRFEPQRSDSSSDSESTSPDSEAEEGKARLEGLFW